MKTVPYAVLEDAMELTKWTQKWLRSVIILLIVLLVGTNAAWMYYENSFEDITQTVEQEAETGTNNFIGGDLIGTADGDNQEAQT